MKTVKGVLLNAGVGASAESVEVSDLESIQGYVGGLIDAVRQPINDDLYVIGYVHDEGLVLDLEMNWCWSMETMMLVNMMVTTTICQNHSLSGYKPISSGKWQKHITSR